MQVDKGDIIGGTRRIIDFATRNASFLLECKWLATASNFDKRKGASLLIVEIIGS